MNAPTTTGLNPLLDFSDLPRFDAIKPEHVTPAVDTLLEQNRALIAKLEAPMAQVTWENFVEPLEASSIGTTIQQCFMLLPDLFFYDRGEELTAERYNKHMKIISENIVDFIQLHYFTKRDNSEFWKWCKNEIVPTEFNAKYIEYFKKKLADSSK